MSYLDLLPRDIKIKIGILVLLNDKIEHSKEFQWVLWELKFRTQNLKCFGHEEYQNLYNLKSLDLKKQRELYNRKKNPQKKAKFYHHLDYGKLYYRIHIL